MSCNKLNFPLSVRCLLLLLAFMVMVVVVEGNSLHLRLKNANQNSNRIKVVDISTFIIPFLTLHLMIRNQSMQISQKNQTVKASTTMATMPPMSTPMPDPLITCTILNVCLLFSLSASKICHQMALVFICFFFVIEISQNYGKLVIVILIHMNVSSWNFNLHHLIRLPPRPFAVKPINLLSSN